MREAPTVRPPAGHRSPARPDRPSRPERTRPTRPPRPRATERLAALVAPAAAAIDGAIVTVDPRFAARRIDVRRDEGRRRLRRLLWLGGAVGVVVVALAATRTPALDLDHLEVTGSSQVTLAQVEEVLGAAGVQRGDPLLFVDLGAATRALAHLPALTGARVQREWPGTLVIDLTDRVPVAALPVVTGRALVGADGVVVAVVDPATPAGLVTVSGPYSLVAGDHLDEPGLLAVAADLPPALVPAVASIAPGDGEAAVELRLAAGGVVRLGAADQLGAKLAAAATVLAQVDLSCLEVLDVRVPAAPAITRASRC